jgi:orotidine-5'-phosphate decarboxylase
MPDQNIATPRKKPFNDLLDSCASSHSGSKVVLALDIPYRESTSNLLDNSKLTLREVSDFVCAVKINFHLIIPLSLRELTDLNGLVHSLGLCSVADIKLNDIDSTNETAANYLWDCGFDAIIVNPFVGFRGGLDTVYERSRLLGKGIISLAYMSHSGADESYGIETATGASIYEIMIERANLWDSDGVIVGSTRSGKIREARSLLRKSIKIISPGSGAQGGDPVSALNAGSDYFIYGRSILTAKDAREAAKQIFQALKSQVSQETC